MQVQCDYCGRYISDTDKFCGGCGAVNNHFSSTGDGVPKTIDQLREWAAMHNLPLDKMRVFIGENFTEPRAFGIYREADEFIVYKNKADGSRAVRYRGKDEAYAVNELYLKMKSEVDNQRAHAAGAADSTPSASQAFRFARKKNSRTRIGCLAVFVIAILLFNLAGVIGNAFTRLTEPKEGYYSYNDAIYYYYNYDWYVYDAEDGIWYETATDSLLENDHRDYYLAGDYNASYGVTAFDIFAFYTPNESWFTQNSYTYDYTTDSWYSDYGYSYYDDDGYHYDYEADPDYYYDDYSDSWYYAGTDTTSDSDSFWSSSDWDSDYDWDSGSDWDTGWSDWDSDW